MTEHRFPKNLPEGALDRAADATLPVIAFDPVPRQRARRNGWSEERQRAFIVTLATCGSVAAAARSVGLTARTAYRLCDAPGAESFVRAWDQAIDFGISQLRADSLKRSLEGGFVPVYRRGKLVRVEHRRNDKLAIALLGGQRASSDDLAAVPCRAANTASTCSRSTRPALSTSARSRRPKPPSAPKSTA